MQLALTFLLTLGGLQAPDEILFEGTGPHTRAIVCESAGARRYFNQGLNFLYAFNYGEAKRSFRAAVRLDPKCAMAYWGLAMANGPHINNMAVEPSEEMEASGSLLSAQLFSRDESAVNIALIRATTVRFELPQPKDRTKLNLAFANEMRKVWKKFPKDADVGAIFAEAMMDLRPWDLWTPDYKPHPGTLEIVSALEAVNKIHPRHPLGLHLYIHAVEASAHPEKAVDEADKLRDLQPALGHNVHMPSHIDVRIGTWQKAVIANTKAIAADRAYHSRRPEQFIYRFYMAHDFHMLAFAAMMTGQSKLAIENIDAMVSEMPEDFKTTAAPMIDGFIAMPIEVRKRFGKWDEILAMPALPEHFPLARAMQLATRAISYAAKGMPTEARVEQVKFFDAVKRIPADGLSGNNNSRQLAQIGMRLMNGEILIAEGKPLGALAELRKGVVAEDSLRYSEPPDWIQPVRHTLGALLLKEKMFAEAEKVYREDLVRLPANGWGLYGLAASLSAQGKDAEPFHAKFFASWRLADMKITSSCMCLPGKD